jgi:hypothetical protein
MFWPTVNIQLDQSFPTTKKAAQNFGWARHVPDRNISICAVRKASAAAAEVSPRLAGRKDS